MNTLADLHRAVQATLTSKRLGTPVFVRYLYHRPVQGPAVAADLARTVAVVRGWLGGPVRRVYAVGGVDARQVTLTLEFANAATALVTWAGTAGRGVDLTVVGNHGALYHDVGDADPGDEELAPAADPPVRALVAVIERALRSGRPEAVEGTP